MQIVSQRPLLYLSVSETGLAAFLFNSEPFSEESGFFLQVILPPLGQALEVWAFGAQQVLKIQIRQVALQSEKR